MPQRVRRRYLAIRFLSDQIVDERDAVDAIRNAVLKLFGEYGASQANLRLILYDEKWNYAIVRCSHKALQRVRASIAAIKEINEKPVAIHVMGVSGTLRATRKKYGVESLGS